MTRGQRPMGITFATSPVRNVGRKVNRKIASTTPAQAERVISALCTLGPACSSSQRSSLLSFCFFFLFFLFRHGNIGGVHQVFVPVHQVFHHIAHSAHQGNFIVPVGGHIGIAQINRAVRAAYRAADFFSGPAHHNALHQGLAAHRGTGIFQLDVVLAAWVLLYFCGQSGSCRCSCPAW